MAERFPSPAVRGGGPGPESGDVARGAVVGIDVVDLGNPRTRGRASEERFVCRVLAEEERDAVRAARAPDTELWCRWAAKEAAFKVVSKVRGTPPSFVHRSFVVGWEADAGEWEGLEGLWRRGLVRYGELQVPIRVQRSDDVLDALAILSREGQGHLSVRAEALEAPGETWSRPLAELRSRLTERELSAVHSRASVAVRVAARADLARTLELSEERIELVCAPGPTGQRPPHVYIDGEPFESADVSLSHDGPWIAWATWVAASPARPGPATR